MKLVRVLKMCLNETYSRVRVGVYVSDMFPFKNGVETRDTLTPLLFHLAVEYVIRTVEEQMFVNDLIVRKFHSGIV
jgi:hypothetical protein